MSTSHFVAASCKLEGDAFVSNLQWSKMDPIAAMAASTIDDSEREIHQVLFINNEGSLIKNSAITHDYEVETFDWQPNGKILAIGWSDGMISCWNVDGRVRPTSSFSNSSQHNSAVTVVLWSPNGKRLITGDKRGQVCVWAADSRGTLTPIRQYRKKGEISSAVFCASPTSHNNGHGGGVGENAGTYSSITISSIGGRMTISDARRGDPKNSCPPFFFGTDRGVVVYADDHGFCNDVQQLSSSIDTMLFFEERNRLVIITRSLLLTQYQIGEDGKVTRVMQVKLSVAGDVAERGLKNVTWASPGLVVMATQEKMVRLLDLAADASYNLSLSALGNIVERTDKVISVAFGPLDRHLCIGTQGGCVGIWKFTGPSRDVSGSRTATVATSAEDWSLLYKTLLSSPVHELNWYSGQSNVGAVTDDGAVVLSETIMRSGMCGDLYVVQTTSQEVSVHINGEQWVEHTGLIVRGIALGRSCFVVWSGKKARVFNVDPHLSKCEAYDPFECSSMSLAIGDSSHIVEDSVFISDGLLVKVCNFAGTAKGSINFSEAEGGPLMLDLNGQYLGVITKNYTVRFFDVHSPVKPKPLGGGHTFTPTSAASSKGSNKDSGEAKTGDQKMAAAEEDKKASKAVSASPKAQMAIRSVKINAEGTRLAILADHEEGVMKVHIPHTEVFVFDRNKGGTMSFDFATHRRCPHSIFWDDHDDRVLVCEAHKDRSVAVQASAAAEAKDKDRENADSLQADTEGEAESAEVEVFLLFATTEHGILMQDSFSRKEPYGDMLGIIVPRLYFRDGGSATQDNQDHDSSEGKRDDDEQRSRIFSKVMRDFVGLDDVDPTARTALLEFSYNLTLGKLDEAYKSVKAIDSPAIWENMAQMCVKTKRLDVAEVCLGNMGHARGAAAVRLSKKEGDSTDTTVGVLAVQLGLLDDAARLFRETERHDKLNKLYQSAGVWAKAIKVAQTHDRIHLKNTHHLYAKHLETLGEIDDAIEHYELANTHKTEVPRMLFNLDRIDDLEDYVNKTEDADMLKWWAKYLESKQRYDRANKYYARAQDYLSLVRVCCYKGDYPKAAEIVTESNDKSAAYHLARQLESKAEYEDAIEYYAKAGCFNHSIRLARKTGMDGELMRYALKSTHSLMLECAQHFEKKGELEKAIQLHHKGGDLSRALDLCFRAGEEGKAAPNKREAQHKNAAVFEMLNNIASDLGHDTNPQTLAKCADFLVHHKQYDRAVELYVMAKKYIQAVEMCLENRVTISEAMVETMTPPEDMDSGEKKALLSDIGKALKLQGSYTLASKKYVQAGDRVRAIKCLVRAGDTKAVMQFANISRNAEIYKLAANYLQQMNWRESVEIMKAIIMFYTKSKSFEQLAGFYDSCAQVEIDDYRDYDKAIGALREGTKHLLKSDTRSAADMLARFEQRISIIEKFVQARRLQEKDPEAMVNTCEALLQEPLLEEAIRAGDCLAMLTEHYHGRGKMREAYACIREFENRNIAPHPFLNAEMLNAIYSAVGAQPARPAGFGNRGPGESKGGEEDPQGQPGGAPSPQYRGGAAADDEVEDEIGEELEESIGEEQDEERSPQFGGRGFRK